MSNNPPRHPALCHVLLVLLVPALVSAARAQRQLPTYRTPTLPIDARVKDLLRRMTLEEKVAQMTCLWQQKPYAREGGNLSSDRGDFSPEKASKVMANGIGQIARQRE